MLDRTIPFFNIILKCEHYKSSEMLLPEGFHLRMYQEGDEKAWASLEYEIGDFESFEEAEAYFVSAYCQDPSEAKKRCIFLVNECGDILGSCIAWRDRRGQETVASLHWLVVSPAYQGQGLGKALAQKTMERFYDLHEFPVYIHTQPWSYPAIFLYIGLGFRLQKKDTFSHYENQYAQAMNALKKIVNESQYERLLNMSE